jgi:hypothetical protein
MEGSVWITSERDGTEEERQQIGTQTGKQTDGEKGKKKRG